MNSASPADSASSTRSGSDSFMLASNLRRRGERRYACEGKRKQPKKGGTTRTILRVGRKNDHETKPKFGRTQLRLHLFTCSTHHPQPTHSPPPPTLWLTERTLPASWRPRRTRSRASRSTTAGVSRPFGTASARGSHGRV